MDVLKKNTSNNKYLLTGGLKKNGIICWRYVFYASERHSGTEKAFFIELEMLNPYISPSEKTFGLELYDSIKPDDFQYALAGTPSATEMVLGKVVQPSYVVVRFGSFGKHSKQLCLYETIQNIKISQRPFEIQVGNCSFTNNHLSGFVKTTEEEVSKHPWYFRQSGYAEWNLDFEIIHQFEKGYKDKTDAWLPIGVKANFSGMINYCGENYIVNPVTSFGYFDKCWGKKLPNPYLHISASCLSSIISGRTLFDSSFVVHGLFEDRVSLQINFEGNEFSFCANENKKNYTCLWDCQEVVQNDEEQLHWSLSVTNKSNIVDVDIFCNIKELFNKVLELPEGNRNTLSIVTSCSGIGEIKLYKKNKNNLEQIEYIRIAKALCEFGKNEELES